MIPTLRVALLTGVRLARQVALGALVGVAAGVASAVFLAVLATATDAFAQRPGLLYGLPLAGFAIGLAYHHGGGRSHEGNNLILDEIHEPTAWVPRRMAPLVFAGTVVTHLFGGSAGREGTAIQMAGSLTDAISRLLRLGAADRRTMLVAAMAGGFGSVFGVPLAGAVFALEVQSAGPIRTRAVLPCLAASVVGDLTTVAIWDHHMVTPQLPPLDLDPLTAAKVGVAGAAFGLVAAVFIATLHATRRLFARAIAWPPLRPVIGGVVVVALTVVVGDRAYNGLSEGLIEASLFGADVPTWAFALKLVFTAATLGSGFVGGEVTPLFVIGTTLGATLAGLLGLPVPLMAALGFVAVFAGATNTPLACTIMGVELFGGGAVVYVAIACLAAYVFSTHRGIYVGQRRADRRPPRTGPG